MDFTIDELIERISIPNPILYKNKFEQLSNAKEFAFKNCKLYISLVNKDLWLISDNIGNNYNFVKKYFEIYSLKNPDNYRINLFDALDVIKGLENEKL